MASRVFIFLCVVIAAILIPRIIRLTQLLKYGKVVYNHQPGPCQLVKGIENGSEDMQVLPNGMVLISSGLRFQKDITVAPWKDIRGHIMLYDVSSPLKAAVPLNIKGNIDLKLFNPHGLSIWQEKGKVSVFVVNHLPEKEVIEVFTFDPQKPTELQHEESIVSEFITFPNDLVAVGPRQFYVTNYAKFYGHGSILAKVETFMMLHLASVAYYDGQDSRIVVDGLMIANGINKSPDGKYIYVMSIGDEMLKVYERQADNELIFKQDVKVGAIDNIDVDQVTGDLWLAGHPTPHAVEGHFNNPKEIPAPSQALHLKTSGGLVQEISEVYSEDGSKFVSASSVAVHYKNKLIIGTVCHRAVHCDIMHPQ